MIQNSSVKTISPHEARAKMAAGAALLDVREYPEWMESHVPGATLIPLGEVKREPQRAALSEEVLLLCRSGRRAAEAAQTMAEAGVACPLVVQGGIEAWKSAGLPVQGKQAGGPISLERQVRLGAGALVLLGLLVPRARPISFFVGCGLVFAGASNVCGMGLLLARAPWNRPRGAAASRSQETGAAQTQP